MSGRLPALLWLVLVLGVVGRVVAVGWNDLPHGDVHLDLQTVRSVVAGEGLRTPLERALPLYAPVDDRPGYPLDQHPPLLVLLAAPLVPVAGDAYLALQLVSLLAGLLALAAAAWSAARVLGRDAALPAAALVAGSYALLDFSGNGSIYALQTALALAVPGALTLRFGAPLAGAICALAWLTNYQAAVYAVAVVLAFLVARRTRGLPAAAGVALGFVAVALPWWLRNLEVFGDPFFSVNPLYLRARFGGVPTVVDEGGGLVLGMDGPALSALAVALVKNLVVNVRFVATQTPLWLGPLLFAGLAGAWASFDRGRRESSPAAVVLLLLPALHVVTMIAWPACKFRYVVPLVALAVLPALVAARGGAVSPGARRLVRGLALLLGLVALERLARGGARDGLVLLAASGVGLWAVRGGLGRIVGAFLALQLALGAAAAPTLSTYYDGILVADVFGRHDAEAVERERQRALAAFAERIELPPGAVVLGPIELKSRLERLTVVQPPPVGDPEAIFRCYRDAERRFGAVHLVVEGDEAAEALRTLGCIGEAPITTSSGGFALFPLLR